MLVSTMMSVHDDGNHTDGPIEMVTRGVSRAYSNGDLTRIFMKDTNRRANWPDSGGTRTEPEMQRQTGETPGQR